MIRTIWEIVLKTVRHPILLLLPLLQRYTRLHLHDYEQQKPPSNNPINVQLQGGSYDHNYDVIIAVVSELDSPESRVWFRDNLQGASHVAGDVPRPPPFFVLRFSFSIIQKAWEL